MVGLGPAMTEFRARFGRTHTPNLGAANDQMVCLLDRVGGHVGRLDGQVALVTGAESGIGRATALTFAKEGAAIVGAGLRPALGNELLDELAAEGLRGEFVAGDVATADGAARAVSSAMAMYGTLNIVVLRRHHLVRYGRRIRGGGMGSGHPG